jgi:hypothetical protein
MNEPRKHSLVEFTDKWELDDEALDFIHLHHARGESRDYIRAQIVMTDQDEKYALLEFPAQAVMIRNIKRARWETWKRVCYGMDWLVMCPPNLEPIEPAAPSELPELFVEAGIA